MPRKKTLTLTNAEHRIMEVIWAKGSATVADVVEALKGVDAYTTILTLMRILKVKGYLSSRKEGRAFVFVPKVDVVSGVGYDRAAALGAGGRFHAIRRVVSNKGVFDFETADHTMRVVSLHPGVTKEDVIANTGFPLVFSDHIETTRAPTAEELRLIRDVIDPKGLAKKEIKG